jgi:hypothetical protein
MSCLGLRECSGSAEWHRVFWRQVAKTIAIENQNQLRDL